MNFMLNLLLKKYLNYNLRTLLKIHRLGKKQGFIYYSEIEEYLNRGRNQVSTILSKLEADNLISREKDHHPQKIKLTNTGKELIKMILYLIKI